MNSVQAFIELKKAQREYNTQSSLEYFYKNRLNAISGDRNNCETQKKNLFNTKISLEKRLSQVNDIINKYSKISQDISLSNHIIQNIQNLYQESILCDSITSSNLFDAFKIKDISQSQSIISLRNEKERLELRILQLKRDLNNLEVKINELNRNISALEYSYNEAARKTSNAQNQMIYFKKFI